MERKPTVVAVLVDGDDLVQDDSVRVEVEVDIEQSERSGWKNLDHRSFRNGSSPIHWPIEFKLEDRKNVGESYSLLAVAYDAAGAVVARAQAIRTGQKAVDAGLSVRFESQCFRRPSVCSEGMTCHGGACISARDEKPATVTETNPIQSETGTTSGEPKEGLANEGDTCATEDSRACMGHGTRA